MQTEKLERLDTETRSKIRSTQILTSFPQLIAELVQNSLDAGAKQIDVGVNFGEWSCWVRDDGCGISKDDLSLIAQGGERGRYISSKSYDVQSLDLVNTFGFRGEALSSIAALSCLEIASRTQKSKGCWSLILKDGDKLYCGPSLRWKRERAGTTVSIRDAFFNLPIRRISHPNAAKTLELIRKDIAVLALVHPNVVFSLENSERDNREGSRNGRILSIPKMPSMLSTFRHLFGRALIEHVEEINESMESIRIEGFFSLVGTHSKTYQFLYVNRHLLEYCSLHRLIDQKFSNSSFSKHAYDESGETRTPRLAIRRSPKKGERRPIYVLNISVPSQQIDNWLEPAKAAVLFRDQGTVTSFLGDIIQNFLVKHGFGSIQNRGTSTRASVHKRRRTDGNVGIEVGTREAPHSGPLVMDMNFKNDTMIDIDIQNGQDSGEQQITWSDPVSGRVYIVDSRTGNSYIRDEYEQDSDQSKNSQWAMGRTIVDTRWLRSSCKSRINGRAEEVGEEMPDWMREILKINGSFISTEPNIPQFPSWSHRGADASLPTGSGRRSEYSLLTTRQVDEAFATLTTDFRPLDQNTLCSLTKECLASAQVIAQVDQKFIACLVGRAATRPFEVPCEEPFGDPHHTRTLVLIDQHAADERVRVEKYLKPLCIGFLDRLGRGVEKRMLRPPAPVLLNSMEKDRLISSTLIKSSFRNWGFEISEETVGGVADNQDNVGDYGLVYFNSVPEVVADKLLSGNDLSELVKGFLSKLELESAGNSDDNISQCIKRPEISSPDDYSWFKALRFCPRELIDLVNSKACRGAIMFNDHLTIDQCKRLIKQLAKTAFPFQCAHGRPSAVPLMTVQGSSDMVSSFELATASRPIDWTYLDVIDVN